jgi:hypothetical protein
LNVFLQDEFIKFLVEKTVQAFKAPTPEELDQVEIFKVLLTQADKIFEKYEMRPAVRAKLIVKLNEMLEKTKKYQ